MAVCLAKHGYEVTGIDPNTALIQKLSRGEAPFYEPNLGEYVKSATETGKLRATPNYESNSKADLTYIAVGTPSREDGSIDLGYVKEAAGMIGRSLRNASQHQLVVVKSTVLPGTARSLVKPTIEKESGKIGGKDFSVCSNPEFLREGRAIHDTELPDRIIIGSDQPSATERLETIYRAFHGGNLPTVIKTSFENAELIKYANNAFLATKVSFINSIAGIAERVPNADVKSIAQGIGLDDRIGPKFLNAGLGWGGSCFPKDLAALLHFSQTAGSDPELIRAVIDTNRRQAEKATEFAKQALGSFEGKRIAILGLSFKPETDDLRDAVSIPIINSLLKNGADVRAWDPRAMTEARRIFGDHIKYSADALDCLNQTDCCILVTEWPEFKNIRPETFAGKMRQPIVIDGRRVYDPVEFRKAGIRLQAIGLGPEP
jgi:UDPglucose 6-dehydrogenase